MKGGQIMNTNVLRNLSYGVYVISTLDGTRPTGCIANSVMQITSSPVTVALSMNHDNFTNTKYFDILFPLRTNKLQKERI